jgi:NADH-quinone oxidoreductase subunit J
VGFALFTEFALPFEIVSLVLLSAIVGAVVMAKRKSQT